MKLKTFLTVMLSLLLFAGTSLADTGAWHTDWDSAAAEAKKTDKPILMDFTGSDWCGWCIRLKDEVFSTPEFKTWAKQNVVLLELDFPRKKPQAEEVKQANLALAQKYGIQGFPTIIFAQPDGKALGKLGYLPGGPAAWTGKANEIIK